MKEFATPIEERQRLSRIHRRRYWSDAEYRLRKINRVRIGQGLSPRSSVDEIRTRGPLTELEA